MMTNIVYCLLTHPAAYARLQAEVDAVFPPGESAKDTAKQAEMVYLNAVMYVGPSAAHGERVVDMVP